MMSVAEAGGAERIEQLIRQTTLEEKAALTVGRDFWTTNPVERLGIPSIWLSDGPTGVRKAQVGAEVGIGSSVPATCFPTASAVAASWDVDLARTVGEAIGQEAQAQEVQVLLGPGVGLKRSPLAGRNFEYFSEDPYLSGYMAAGYINGVQSQGVGTSLKHLVANENETARMAADSVVDERVLREVYLRPFELAIEESDPWTLMAAYNHLNGVYCSEDPWLLRQVLVEEWGYDGVVMSDWLAVNDRVAALDAGLHLQMPYGPSQEQVVAAVREGRLAESRLDELVAGMLRLIFRADSQRRPETTFDKAEHHRLARQVAAECMVLLKNDGDLLPLVDPAPGSVAILGGFARNPRFQGAGSSEVVPTRVESAYEALVELIGEQPFAAGYGDSEEPDEELLQEAVDLAAKAEVALVFVGLPGNFEEEGADRIHLDLPGSHMALVERVAAVQPRTVVVLTNGAAVTMPWINQVPAVLESWLTGQAGGGAVADVVTGRVNPSGKLAETFPRRLSDTSSYLDFPNDGTKRTVFSEGLFTGYRWFDAREIEPLFSFGHGLSYTKFAYESIELDRENVAPDGGVTVSVMVRNEGQRAGAEVVQLYVSEPGAPLPRPRQELRAFAKALIKPGAVHRVELPLRYQDFALWDPVVGQWVVSGGTYEIRVGASSRDIRLVTTVEVEASPRPRVTLTRLSLLREWLDDPRGRELLTAQAGGQALTELLPVPEQFLVNLPLAKLALMGIWSEEDVERLEAEVNA